jgi:hypothetical protein
MTGSLSTFPPKSLEGMRKPSLWVRSFNTTAHTQLIDGLINNVIFSFVLLFFPSLISFPGKGYK